jgi:hypothetical protein
MIYNRLLLNLSPLLLLLLLLIRLLIIFHLFMTPPKASLREHLLKHFIYSVHYFLQITTHTRLKASLTKKWMFESRNG